MDCRDGLKLIDDGMIDIVMTDIPYNISQKKSIDRSAIDSKALKRSGNKKELNFNYGKWDFFADNEAYFSFIQSVFVEVYRVMKDSASLYMWVPKMRYLLLNIYLKI